MHGRLGRYPGDLHQQFDHMFFFGDLNYRINLDRETVLQLIAEKKWDEVLAGARAWNPSLPQAFNPLLLACIDM